MPSSSDVYIYIYIYIFHFAPHFDGVFRSLCVLGRRVWRFRVLSLGFGASEICSGSADIFHSEAALTPHLDLQQ